MQVYFLNLQHSLFHIIVCFNLLVLNISYPTLDFRVVFYNVIWLILTGKISQDDIIPQISHALVFSLAQYFILFTPLKASYFIDVNLQNNHCVGIIFLACIDPNLFILTSIDT